MKIQDKDPLGTRIKDLYENVYRYKLLGNTYTIIRIDGKNFSTYCKGLQKPFDDDLIEDMNSTAKHLCENIMGCKLAFTQSDEISLVLTDFDTIETEAWFRGNLQKICSISSSYATSKFNQLRMLRECTYQSQEYFVPVVNEEEIQEFKLANFDARVFQIPYIEEVINCLIWRQQDATRNSISSVAQSLYSHKELHGKNSSQLQEMIFAKGINWNDLDEGKKKGRLIVKQQYEKNGAIRNKWDTVSIPIFSSLDGKEFLRTLLTPKQL